MYSILTLLISLYSYAHGDEDEKQIMNIDSITKSAFIIIISASGISGIFVVSAIFYKKKNKKVKAILFLGIVIPIVIATLYSAISTIYLNISSSTKGPVHWHADFEVWVCGNKLELVDPTGISNRIGTPVFHEHNDNRIHVEGVIEKPEDARLHHFFEYIGGELTKNQLIMKTNEGIVEKKNGDICPDGEQGFIQVFVYKTYRNKYIQEKIRDYEDYILSPESRIPPGDCIIIEFAEQNTRTKHICSTYKLAIERGELSGG